MIFRAPRLILALAAIAFLAAWRPAADPLTLKEGSRLWFDGTSSVRSWSCEAPQMNAVIDAEAGAPAAVLGGKKAVRTVDVSFPVDKLDCDNKTMNGHMWKALNSDKHKEIRFTLTSYEFSGTTGVAGTLKGTLLINGQTKPITVPVQFAPADGALRVTGTYPLKMTDWGIEPPRLMMGTLKVGEMVNVQFNLLLQN
jgi:polyisoprenoid-binding protein YceI